MFADDTIILVSHKNYDELTEVLNDVIVCISKWFQENQFHLNYYIPAASITPLVPKQVRQYVCDVIPCSKQKGINISPDNFVVADITGSDDNAYIIWSLQAGS
jgi:hypothetical protein